jgi:hypothetical protein
MTWNDGRSDNVGLLHLDKAEDAGDETEDRSDDLEGVRPIQVVLHFGTKDYDSNKHAYNCNETKANEDFEKCSLAHRSIVHKHVEEDAEGGKNQQNQTDGYHCLGGFEPVLIAVIR